MMGNTFNLVEEDKQGEWAINWAEFIYYTKRTVHHLPLCRVSVSEV